MEKNLTPMLVVAVALIDGDGQVLLQKRPEGTMHAGLWEFPGGKVEAGESAEEAAVREMEEELGVTLACEDLVAVGFASGALDVPASKEGAEARGGRRALVILLYAADAWSGTPDSREGGQTHWYEPGDIASLAMPPLDYPLAKALNCVPLEFFRKK